MKTVIYHSPEWDRMVEDSWVTMHVEPPDGSGVRVAHMLRLMPYTQVFRSNVEGRVKSFAEHRITICEHYDGPPPTLRQVARVALIETGLLGDEAHAAMAAIEASVIEEEHMLRR